MLLCLLFVRTYIQGHYFASARELEILKNPVNRKILETFYEFGKLKVERTLKQDLLDNLFKVKNSLLDFVQFLRQPSAG